MSRCSPANLHLTSYATKIRSHHAPSLGSPSLQNLPHSLHRYKFRLALATSLAAAWLHSSSSSKQAKTSNLVPAASLIVTDADANHRQTKNFLQGGTTRRLSGASSSTRRLKAHHARQYSTSTSSQSSIDLSDSDGNSDASSIASSSTSIDTTDSNQSETRNAIVDLMSHPDLLTDIKKPKHPIVLCHGLYGFDVRGPFWGLEIHYWASVLDILRKRVGAEVIVRGVPGTGAIADRASELHKFLCSSESGIRGKSINFVAHSMGGLDARHIISVIKPKKEEYTPLSLTTVSTPHRGSPFMDWCNANVGTGNDRVEAEIKQAKKKLGEEGGATTKGMQDASSDAKKDSKKLPYSLKTPLFVRPAKKKSASESEGILESSAVVDTLQDAGKEAIARFASVGATPSISSQQDDTSESISSKIVIDDKKGEVKKKDSSSLLNFSAFNKALSNIGGSFSSYMLGVLDQPAYAMLSTRYMSQVFNPSVPNSPDVAYYSIAARKCNLAIWHPLWLPKLVLDAAAESRSAGGERDGSGDALGSELQGNDGLVSVESAKWGTFLGVIEGCDHWDLRGGGAPRWRGRVNPATGKPWPEENKEDKEKKEKEKEKGWMDVNAILGRLLNRTKEDAGKRDGNKSPAEKSERKDVKAPFDEKSREEEEGLLDEVASWISDRLPQGDESRRAEAERVADEQDRKARKYQQASQSERLEIDYRDRIERQEAKEDESDSDVKVEMKKKTSKLRRDAAWQEELGHEDAARELRRELAWHRAEWDRYTTAKQDSSANVKLPRPYPHQRELDWDRHSKRKEEKDNKEEKKKLEEANELERFWIAICRHLWSQGL